jgi:hypothetical protein
MSIKLKLFPGSLVLAIGLVATGMAQAQTQPSATTNQCWGDVASQLGQRGITGQHSSSHSVFTPDPGEGGRKGVANQNQVLADNGDISTGDPGEGGNGLHAIFVGGLVGTVDPVTGGQGDGDPIVCDGTPGNPPPG